MKTIKLITLILIVVLISLISFGGLFLKTDYKFENVLPEYKLGRNLSASRVVEIIPDPTVNKVIKDAEGNVVEKEGENTVTEEVPVNSADILNKENYNNVKKIVIARLKQMGVQDYTIRLNEENGKVVLELEDSEITDSVSNYISQKGDFVIVDEETEEILMNNDDIELTDVRYAPDQTGMNSGTVVYLNIGFNKEGAKKLEDISSKYIKTTDEEGNDTTKKVSLKIDGQEIVNTAFTEKLTTGSIQITLGNSSNDINEIQDNLTSAGYMAMLLNNQELPIKYKTESDQYVSSNIVSDDIMPYAVYVIAGVIGAIIIVMFFRYKGLGILGAISIIGFTGTLLILLRYTNVVITLEGIIGIVFSIILDLLLVKVILNEVKNGKNAKEAIKEMYKKYFVYIIFPIIVMSIVFSFIKVVGIASLGMTMFWGIALLALYNIIITRAMLVIAKK